MSDAEDDSLRRTDSRIRQDSAPQSLPLPPKTGKAELPSQPQGITARDELLSKARMFLTSPSVQPQDVDAKRTFLREKGLNEHDIEDLLRTLPPQIPPRTYPLPPPSNLPVLLLKLARLVSWVAGGTVILVFLYHRLLLPRITETLFARRNLKSHHLSLLRRLTTSLAALKESQAESFSVLPRPESPWKELEPFSKCRTVKDVLDVVSEKGSTYSQIPHVTLLRCGIRDVSVEKEGETQPTTAELFGYLERQISWLATDEGMKFEEKLWNTLTTAPVFKKGLLPSSPDSSQATGLYWQYVAPAPIADPPILKSLDALQAAFPGDRVDSKTTASQYTLQSLSDLTGYITTQVYLPFRAPLAKPATDTAEDEVRREIKALKGLVLNRRSFMATIPRPSITMNT